MNGRGLASTFLIVLIKVAFETGMPMTALAPECRHDSATESVRDRASMKTGEVRDLQVRMRRKRRTHANPSVGAASRATIKTPWY
jgi:hypothetical protein